MHSPADAERIEILRALVALDHRCHEVVDLVRAGRRDVRGEIGVLLDCGPAAAAHVHDIFRALSPDAQTGYRAELEERYGDYSFSTGA